MIQTKEDLEYYLQEDKLALGRERKRPGFQDLIWKFQICLRKHEYYFNNRNTIKNKLLCRYYIFQHNRLGYKLGFDIPINVFKEGLRINHFGNIVINPAARIGSYCDIHQGVNIGSNKGKDDAPKIGDKVWIGPGVKIFGDIKIGDYTAIAANSVVNKSFEETKITIAGMPAKKVKDSGTDQMFAMAAFLDKGLF